MKGNESSEPTMNLQGIWIVYQRRYFKMHQAPIIQTVKLRWNNLFTPNWQSVIFLEWLFLEIVVFRDTMHGTIIWFDGSLQSLLVFLEVKPTTRRLRSQPSHQVNQVNQRWEVSQHLSWLVWRVDPNHQNPHDKIGSAALSWCHWFVPAMILAMASMKKKGERYGVCYNHLKLP